MAQSNETELLPPELQVSLQALKAVRPLAAEFNYARAAGVEIVVHPDVESEYVKEHGAEGQNFLDILLGRKKTIAAIKFKVKMRLEDDPGCVE